MCDLCRTNLGPFIVWKGNSGIKCLICNEFFLPGGAAQKVVKHFQVEHQNEYTLCILGEGQ